MRARARVCVCVHSWVLEGTGGEFPEQDREISHCFSFNFKSDIEITIISYKRLRFAFHSYILLMLYYDFYRGIFIDGNAHSFIELTLLRVSSNSCVMFTRVSDNSR